MTPTRPIAVSDLQEFLESAPDAMIVVDQSGRIVVPRYHGSRLPRAANRELLATLGAHFGSLLAAKRANPGDGS
jgi:hypothetical protein